eukprot:scaffold198748_cov29-Prasinocladus_malaysianus.AAC.2
MEAANSSFDSLSVNPRTWPRFVRTYLGVALMPPAGGYMSMTWLAISVGLSVWVDDFQLRAFLSSSTESRAGSKSLYCTLTLRINLFGGF